MLAEYLKLSFRKVRSNTLKTFVKFHVLKRSNDINVYKNTKSDNIFNFQWEDQTVLEYVVQPLESMRHIIRIQNLLSCIL